MRVNVKKVMIIAAVAILILLSAALLFFMALINQNVSAPIQSRSPSAQAAAPNPGYSIPANTMPSGAEIEANIKKTQDERAEIKKMSELIAAEDAARRQEIRQQLEAAAAAPEAATIIDTTAKTEASTSSQKVVVNNNPTREERKAMQIRGIVAY